MFFVCDPSSSTSLLASVGISTRKNVKQTAGSCGNFRISDPKMSLTTPVRGKIEVNPDSVGSEGSDGAMHVAVNV